MKYQVSNDAVKNFWRQLKYEYRMEKRRLRRRKWKQIFCNHVWEPVTSRPTADGRVFYDYSWDTYYTRKVDTIQCECVKCGKKDYLPQILYPMYPKNRV